MEGLIVFVSELFVKKVNYKSRFASGHTEQVYTCIYAYIHVCIHTWTWVVCQSSVHICWDSIFIQKAWTQDGIIYKTFYCHVRVTFFIRLGEQKCLNILKGIFGDYFFTEVWHRTNSQGHSETFLALTIEEDPRRTSR